VVFGPKEYRNIIELEGRELTHDPNPTSHGIEQAEYAQYRKQNGIKVQSVEFISDSEAMDIYLRYYWRPMNCTYISEPLDFILFQFGVNCGTQTAIMYLQTLLRVLPDGFMGRRTLEHLKDVPVIPLSKNLLNKQAERYIEHYKDKPGKDAELVGLLNRVKKTAEFYNIKLD